METLFERPEKHFFQCKGYRGNAQNLPLGKPALNKIIAAYIRRISNEVSSYNGNQIRRFRLQNPIHDLDKVY